MPVRLVSHEELPGPLKGYRLLERLGRGGFGEVWKCEAPGGLLKAVKFVFGDLDAMDEDSRPAEQEAKALERVKGIRHPYILSLEQFRVIDGQLIIVMELADRNLWDRFRECRGQGLVGIPREELLSYMNEAAEALDLMNNYYQIQHLDIKPQNLFLVFNHIKVADFGLAKALEGIRATVTGGVTPVYAAPETFEGWVSRFSDQYSLAIVFQELLTGTRPFTGTNTRQLLMQHLNGTPEMGALNEADRQAIGRALSKKPDDRWPTCTDLVRALKESGGPPPSRPQGGSRLVPGSGTRTAPAPVPHALADSILETRAIPGGPVPITDEDRARARTPPPSLPPLRPAGAPGSLPPLHTPAGSQARLVTPLSGPAPSTGLNPALTLSRNSVFQTARMGALGVAPPERTGDGALFPALVVALGHSGRMVAEALKRAIADRHGSAERLPNLRFLYLDTDADALAAAASTDGALTAREVVPIRLNRSTHYLQRDGLPNVEQWLPHGLLYKLPRNPGAANGVRAFGRLALVDNFRAVAQRVRQEVETFLSDEPLNRAEQTTRLGLRSNRPRAYVIAGLGGGTGGGTFLDVAFLLRRELKQVGFVRPEVVGQFFVPPPDPTTGRSFPLGNTYAALAELHHFQAQRSLYQSAFEKSEGPITDDAPPFTRAAVLQVPADATRSGPVFAAAAQALYTELLAPAGRTADEARDVYRKAYPLAAPACQTFGLYRLNWPRAELLAAATRRLAHGLLTRWTGKEAAHLREPVAGWLTQQWAERRLATESVTAALNAAARDSVREDPERVFDAFIDPLTAAAGTRFDAAAAVTVLDHLLKLVGKPECEGELDSGSLFRALSARYDELVKEVETHVGIMAATFIEVPQYRLPGAEEAVRQFADRFKRQVEVLEKARASLDREVRSTYVKLIQALGALGSTGAMAAVTRKANASEVLEYLRAYPRARLRLHVLDLVLAVFRRLSANAPEYLRDINSCRAALAEMCADLSAPPPSADPGPCATILPDGCATLDAAADQFLANLAAEDLLAFDQKLQKDLTRKFRGLGSICLKPIEKGPLFRTLLLAKAREFLDSKLDHSDAALVFLRSRTQVGSAAKQLAEAYDEAEPLVRPTNARAVQQLAVLAVPPGPAGEQVQALARDTLHGVDLVPAALPDDICFYRELPQVPLTDLPHLGGQAREAYLQMAGDHPAHSRLDVPWQHPG
jgi:eukaryotic-like serine/threonine-protein kinase